MFYLIATLFCVSLLASFLVFLVFPALFTTLDEIKAPKLLIVPIGLIYTICLVLSFPFVMIFGKP